MQSKTQTTLSQLRIGDSFVYPKRVDAWRVMARADKNGRVAVNQVSSSRKTIHKYDELKKGSTTVIFLRHTIPVSGEECLVDDLTAGDVFLRPDDIIHEYVMVERKYPFSDVRRTDQASNIKAGIFSTVIFIKHKERL